MNDDRFNCDFCGAFEAFFDDSAPDAACLECAALLCSGCGEACHPTHYVADDERYGECCAHHPQRGPHPALGDVLVIVQRAVADAAAMRRGVLADRRAS